ncbi:ABC transporter permease [Prauserella cavernicola]|uniref:ABC transporter permease n=1 Tax=Prauserella cavernicola TaxID=2800127 RepID=A0A934QZ38_9PSEU|nr:ABC transporter permease [Prauserella cavernicola]MBK1789243.1 ABC transporter permease [Prauserella cavernicola]
MAATRAEWTKLWSVRSTWWCLGSAAALMLGQSALTAISESADSSATAIAVEGVFYLVQFVVLALATLTMAGEYSTGSIRSTLQWVPVRRRVPAAKCAVLAPTLFALGTVLAAAAVAVIVPLQPERAPDVSGGEVLRTALAVGGYCALLGMLTVGIAAALRSVAGALTVTFLLLLVAPVLAGGMGLMAIVDYLPGVAGTNVMLGEGAPSLLTGAPVPYSEFVGFAVLVAWTAVALAVGDALLRRRDA